MDRETVVAVPKDMRNGVYFGYASVHGDPPLPMVMSISNNVFFKNGVVTMVSEASY